jgi:hypothetical protein
MDISELLMMGVEVSIAIAGFAGIIATYQFREESNIRRAPVGALTVIVQFSLGPALACAFCLALQAFGMVGDDLWAACSWLGVAIYGYAMYGVSRAMGGALSKVSAKVIFVSLQGVGSLILVSNGLNALGIIFQKEPGPYIAGIFFALSVAAFMFSRLLLRPLWRVVQASEGSNSAFAAQR